MESLINNSGLFIYFIADIFCMLMLIPVLQNIRKSTGDEREMRLFQFLVWSFLVYVVADMIMVTFIEKPSDFPLWFCNLVTIIDEVSILFVAYFWVRFGVARLSFPYEDAKWFRILISIPLIAEIIIQVTSPWTGLFFQITPEGIYQRGSLFFVQAGVIFAYNMSIPLFSIITIIHTKSTEQRRKAASLIKFVISPLATGFIQMLNANTPIMCLGMVLAIYFVYIDVLELQIYHDSLTGMNNRRRAEYFLDDCINNASKEHSFYLYMIDIDEFKLINDKYGHTEGDHALCLVADALKKTAHENHCFTARVGGDEFLLSTPGGAVHDPEVIKEKLYDNLHAVIKQAQLTYPLDISVGYTICDDPHKKSIILVNEADTMLYQKKEKHHKLTKK